MMVVKSRRFLLFLLNEYDNILFKERRGWGRRMITIMLGLEKLGIGIWIFIKRMEMKWKQSAVYSFLRRRWMGNGSISKDWIITQCTAVFFGSWKLYEIKQLRLIFFHQIFTHLETIRWGILDLNNSTVWNGRWFWVIGIGMDCCCIHRRRVVAWWSLKDSMKNWPPHTGWNGILLLSKRTSHPKDTLFRIVELYVVAIELFNDRRNWNSPLNFLCLLCEWVIKGLRTVDEEAPSIK